MEQQGTINSRTFVLLNFRSIINCGNYHTTKIVINYYPLVNQQHYGNLKGISTNPNIIAEIPIISVDPD